MKFLQQKASAALATRAIDAILGGFEKMIARLEKAMHVLEAEIARGRERVEAERAKFEAYAADEKAKGEQLGAKRDQAKVVHGRLKAFIGG